MNALVGGEYKNQNPHILCVGKKVKDAFKRSPMFYVNKNLENAETIFNELTFDNNTLLANSLMDLFLSGEFDKIVVVYNSFVNAASQVVEAEQFLPLVPTAQAEGKSAGDYIFEPSKEEIVEGTDA